MGTMLFKSVLSKCPLIQSASLFMPSVPKPTFVCLSVKNCQFSSECSGESNAKARWRMTQRALACGQRDGVVKSSEARGLVPRPKP